jgi:electron transfer flavoprotein alpha/beta subunit
MPSQPHESDGAKLTREQVVAVLNAADELAVDMAVEMGLSVTHDENIDAIHAAALRALKGER